MVERADRLKAPPVLGKFYLVPAVRWSFNTTFGIGDPAKTLEQLEALPCAKWWPVWGRKHNDIEFFNFPHEHYHIDPRFLTKRQWKEFDWGSHPPLAALQGKPLNHRDLPDGPPRAVLKRMKCTSLDVTWQHGEAKAVIQIQKKFAGHRCRDSKIGLICPHQRFPLGSIEPVDGVITCPLHGLRINAATGHVAPLATGKRTDD